MSRTLLLLPVLLLSAGCAQFRAPTWLPGMGMPEETRKNPTDRVVGVWQATDGRGLNGVPTRGFGGQILFFGRKGESPVKVNGDVRIYVFDDQGDADEQAKPLHQFDFKGGSWNAQLVEGSLGPTYQVFIPYTRKGAHEARCQVRLRYTPEVGPAVYSDVVDVRLPGEEKKRTAEINFARRSAPTERIETISLDRAVPRPRPRTGEPGESALLERRVRMLENMVAERGGLGGSTDRTPAPSNVPPRDPFAGGVVPAAATTSDSRTPVEDRVIVPAGHETPNRGASHPFLGGARRPTAAGDHPLDGPRPAAARDETADPDVTATSAASPRRRYRLAGQTRPSSVGIRSIEQDAPHIVRPGTPIEGENRSGLGTASPWRDGRSWKDLAFDG